MEIILSSFFSSYSFIVAFAATVLCFIFAGRFSSAAVFSSLKGGRRSKFTTERDSKDSDSCSNSNSSRRDFDCKCSCNGAVLSADCAPVTENGGEMPALVSAAEKLTGASMMEQLVPEITTHALSYLDYPSLCRLSMTNSLMRKAANDDNAWKALYHKDFTLEQDSVRPANGWKAYYAATRTIVNINAEFFSILRDRSLPAMSRFWVNADYVKCIHASGELFTGYNAVMGSWQIAFNWEQLADGFQVRDVRARVLSEMAWVTMKTYVDMNAGPFNVTNVFEHHDGRWYMVHHHRSVMLVDEDVDQQIGHA
ncbi:F-box protein SKIP8-like [Chenopodium quinoa]|uniref:F-box protein SKIP8-like n=1 Tax=Chenopodium quinoa TaxID=63459 RepID=UPI000B77FB4E|nr:F-box protein SKIP8-like [Chenopodium quinoa]